MDEFPQSYVNNMGQTVMTKRFVDGSAYVYTYFVYNDFGQLAFVLPPMAIEKMVATSNYNTSALTEEWIYKFKYDERGRLIEKKVPGKGWEYFVYNIRNQLVLSQDAVLAANNKWNYIKYDALGRVIMTGLFDVTSLSSYQGRSNAQTQITAGTTLYESNSSSSFSTNFGYTNAALPTSNITIHTVNYYDGYDYNRNGSADVSFNTMTLPCIAFYPASCSNYTNTVSSMTKGMPTGVSVKVLDAGNTVQWVNTAYFYDAKGQVIQMQNNDFRGGADINNFVYDFAGRLIYTHLKNTATGSVVTTITNNYSYDKMGRILKVEQKTNSDNPIVLSEAVYNELGQLIEKKLHSSNQGNFLQNLDFTYNIRGWLTHINNADLSPEEFDDGEEQEDAWGEELYYNTEAEGIEGVEQYNGNVSQKLWNAANDSIKRAYTYTYDKLNRLTESYYGENTGEWSMNNHFDEVVNYDANGNIINLMRYGFGTSEEFGQIDNLTYTYHGNQVHRIDDDPNEDGFNDFKDNESEANNEMTYDVNGNMTRDDNKQISITYNHLNLPVEILFDSGDKIEYIYDAMGNRLRKIMTTSESVETNKYYVGNFVYNDDGIEFIATPEGRMVFVEEDSKYRYEYAIKDHTGNVVMMVSDLHDDGEFDKETEILQVTHYYPFGMRMNGLATPAVGVENKYKLGGKEMQDEFGLDQYDFGARYYDPATARWNQLDPLAEVATSWTPYRYCFNNPLKYTDPTGMVEKNKEIEKDPYIDWQNEQLLLMASNWEASGLTTYPTYSRGELTYSYFSSDIVHLREIAKDMLGADYNDMRGEFGHWEKGDSRPTTGYDAFLGRNVTVYNIVYNWVPLQGLQNLKTGFQIGEFIGVGAAAGKEIALDYRLSKSYSNRVGMSTNLKTISKLGKASKVLGVAGYGAAGLGTVLDVQAYNEGKMSGERLAYNTSATAVGLGVGYVSGPIAGATAGGLFYIGQQFYDGFNWWAGQMSVFLTNFENGIENGWTPGK